MTTSMPRYFQATHRRLLGGEHPCYGSDVRAHRLRLEALLARGVTTFIDLTDAVFENRITPYGALLRTRRTNGLPVSYNHHPIPDTGVPRSVAYAREILDVVDAALLNREVVYVHCRTGVGRTGTLLALHLVRHGTSPVDALHQVQQAWQRDTRSAIWKLCPQTEAQRRYVLEWPE